jgi:hypothetical protein
MVFIRSYKKLTELNNEELKEHKKKIQQKHYRSYYDKIKFRKVKNEIEMEYNAQTELLKLYEEMNGVLSLHNDNIEESNKMIYLINNIDKNEIKEIKNLDIEQKDLLIYYYRQYFNTTDEYYSFQLIDKIKELESDFKLYI